MTNYNEPNMFCGECGAYAAFGEPETTKEQNEEILNHCRDCKGWTRNNVQLLNKDNVGQCWSCINQTESEKTEAPNGETILIPYCTLKKCYITSLKHEQFCHLFRLR